jgi:DNA processing protein
MNNIYIAALQMVPGIGNVRLRTLIRHFGSAEEAWKAAGRELFLCGCLDENLCNSLIKLRTGLDLVSIAIKWEKQGIRICNWEESTYPRSLYTTFNPPVLIYYRGTLPDTAESIAVVGSRKASAYGKNVAAMLAADLAIAGVWVISGAARGIDTAAHQGALSRGHTLAVLGCGVDIMYPPENSRLLAQIAEQGAVIAEYPPGTPPHAGHFPARNRIISGLARGVVVVEAAERSGALITADFALEEGRDVFAVPGSVFRKVAKVLTG